MILVIGTLSFSISPASHILSTTGMANFYKRGKCSRRLSRV
jgi:hypothetical protein